jgi:hypothetical protein
VKAPTLISGWPPSRCGQRRRQDVDQQALGHLLLRGDPVVQPLHFLVQQAHFEHVVHPQQDFGQVEGLADEVLGPSLQGPQLVRRLGGDHEDGKVAPLLDFIQVFHHLEAVHARHLKVEQDQVVVVDEVEFTDLARIHGGSDGGVVSSPQHLLEQE